MSANNHNAATVRSVVRFLRAAWLGLLAASFVPAAHALDSGDIQVLAVKGDVRVARDGGEKPLRAGTVLELPATVRTGRDGSVELRQGRTTVSIAADSVLEFPALEKRGAPIDRVVQPRGNAFYDVGKRDGRKLRVETPYLVAVIKGTQFNVAAQDDAATISLFEGLLEIHAPDDSLVIALHAGEIASRRRGDQGISVLKMDAKAPPARPSPGNIRGTSQGSDGSGAPDTESAPVSPRSHADHGDSVLAGRVGARDVARPDIGVSTVNLNAGVDTGPARAPVEATANLAATTGQAAADVSTGAALGPVNAGVGAAVDLGTQGVAADVGVNTAVNAGAAGVDIAAGTSVSVSAGAVDVRATVSTGADAGTVSVGADVGAGVAVDLGHGANANVAVNVDVTPGAGPAVVDTSLNTAVDLGAGAPAASVDVDVGTSVAGVNADVGAAANVGAGTVDVSVSLGAVDLDVGVDLGLDDPDTAGDTPNTNTTNTTTDGGNIVDDVGGLLDGLLRRPRGK